MKGSSQYVNYSVIVLLYGEIMKGIRKYMGSRHGEASLLAALVASVLGALTIAAIYNGLSNANSAQRLIAGGRSCRC